MFLQELKEDVRGRMSRTDEDAIENILRDYSGDWIFNFLDGKPFTSPINTLEAARDLSQLEIPERVIIGYIGQKLTRELDRIADPQAFTMRRQGLTQTIRTLGKVGKQVNRGKIDQPALNLISTLITALERVLLHTDIPRKLPRERKGAPVWF